MKKRGAKSAVDVVILTHGSDKRLSLDAGDITESEIRKAGPFPRLRMVYMMACYGASLVDAWRAAGAQVAVGHQEVNSLPGFFFPRFLRRWAEGASVRDATQEAYRFAEGTAQMLSTYISEVELLDATGSKRSEPVIAGVDLDRAGHLYPLRDLRIDAFRPWDEPVFSSAKDPSLAWLEAENGSRWASGGSVNGFAHTEFEQSSIEMLGAMIPQATLNPSAIPSPQMLVNRVKGAAWDQLKDSFPTALPGLPGISVPAAEGEEVWIDGGSLRYFLAAVHDYAGDKFGPLLDHAQGVRLTQTGDSLAVSIYLDQALDLAVQDVAAAGNWTPYSIHVPKAVRFKLRMNEGVLLITGLDSGRDALNLKLKMPWLPDTIWVRNVVMNLTSGQIRVEAGVIGNGVGLIAQGDLLAQRFTGIDLWKTIERNAPLFSFPTLIFHML
jgi:hypothetical protein